MRREFNHTCQQTITLIKYLKNSNDYLNRAIGVESKASISLRVNRESSTIEENTSKIDRLIEKLEQSYLDPDTARKIGTVKQQFRIQKDRRKQLLLSADVEEEMLTKRSTQPQTYGEVAEDRIVEGRSRLNEGRGKESAEGSTWSRFAHKSTESTGRTEGSHLQMHHEQPLGLSYEFQHKMMRERGEQLNYISQNLMNVHSIINQTGTLVHQQGEKIDIIGEELFQTYKNTQGARENIGEANEHQKKARRKYVYLSLIMLLGVAVTVLFLVF